MDLRKALDILKYYGVKILYEELDKVSSLLPDEQIELEDAIDKVRDFIIDMGGKL